MRRSANGLYARTCVTMAIPRSWTTMPAQASHQQRPMSPNRLFGACGIALPRLSYVLLDLIAIPPTQGPSIAPVLSMAKLSYTGMYVSASFVSRFFMFS